MIYKTGRESVILSHEICTNVFGCHSNAPCTSTTKEEGYVLSHPDVGSVATVTSSWPSDRRTKNVSTIQGWNPWHQHTPFSQTGTFNSCGRKGNVENRCCSSCWNSHQRAII